MLVTWALVVGASGLVGGALIRLLADSAVGTYHRRAQPGLRQLDAADPLAMRELIASVAPKVVFFPAASPNVEWCETHPDEARTLNVAPALIGLESALLSGARFVFFSTDYVFDGRAGPYDEIATPAPLNVYGRIKLEIEQAMLAAGQTVVRTTGVFGREPPPGKNFVLSLIASLRRGQRVRVASDQLTTPTWSDDLARAAVAVAERGGIWNAVGPDLLARDAFARLVASTFELDGSLIDSLPTSALEQRARRPLSSGLRTEKLVAFLGASLTPTRTALRQFKDQFRLEDTPPLH